MLFFCVRQGLPLRGHRDDSNATDTDNVGNFLELVYFRATTDDALARHLQNAPRNGHQKQFKMS